MPSTPLPLPSRHYENDWLTVLMTLVIFFFHCARFFDFEGWHVKNNQLSEGLTVFVGVVAQWVMPMFFLLSGMSACFSFGSRCGGSYLGNRVRRMLVPFLFGTFVVLIPVQVWIERVSSGQFTGSFVAFYPHYFDGFYAFGGNFAWMGLHLWYLEMLFIFSLLTYPLFAVLKRAGVRECVADSARFMAKPGAVFLIGVPVFVVEWMVNFQPEGVGIRGFGGWSPMTYLVFFVTGYVVAFDPRYVDAMKRSRWPALALAAGCTSVMFLALGRPSVAQGDLVDYTLGLLLLAFNSWFWVVAITGFARSSLAFGNALLAYGRVVVLPFYILHQTVIVVIGFFIAEWDMSIPLKYLVLAVTAFAFILVAYETLLTRFGVLRLLFGMQSEKKAAPRGW